MGWSRRRFLSSSFGAGFGLMVDASHPAFASGAPQHMRHDAASSLGKAALVDYAEAVRLLKLRPKTDALTWDSLGKIHHDHCPHRNWWFLPWHRAYLLFFERACQKVLNNDDFRLPYWDWSRTPAIPNEFYDQKSSLYHARDLKRGEALPSEAPVSLAAIQSLLTLKIDQLIYSRPTLKDDQSERPGHGQFEHMPHNSVHFHVGGDMRDLPKAASDPIFWLHHANIDRLWESWLRSNGRQTPVSPMWANHKLLSFYDAKGSGDSSIVAPLVKNVMNDADFLPGYDKYEQAPPEIGRIEILVVPELQMAQVEEPVLSPALLTEKPQMLRTSMPANFDGSASFASVASARLPVKIKVAPEAAKYVKATDKRFQSAIVSVVTVSEPTALVIEGVKVETPDLSMRVFVNTPNPSSKTPLTDPGYAGTVYLLGGHGHHGGSSESGTGFVLDFTHVMLKLAAAGRFGQKSAPIDVALVPVNLYNAGDNSSGPVVKPTSARLISLVS